MQKALGQLTKDGSTCMTAKQAIVIKCLQEGKSLDLALEIAGYSPKSIPTTKHQFKKYLATEPELMKKANAAMHVIVDEVIEGHKDASRGTAYKIWERQQDKIDPVVKQSQELKVVATFTGDISEVMNK